MSGTAARSRQGTSAAAQNRRQEVLDIASLVCGGKWRWFPHVESTDRVILHATDTNHTYFVDGGKIVAETDPTDSYPTLQASVAGIVLVNDEGLKCSIEVASHLHDTNNPVLRTVAAKALGFPFMFKGKVDLSSWRWEPRVATNTVAATRRDMGAAVAAATTTPTPTPPRPTTTANGNATATPPTVTSAQGTEGKAAAAAKGRKRSASQPIALQTQPASTRAKTLPRQAARAGSVDTTRPVNPDSDTREAVTVLAQTPQTVNVANASARDQAVLNVNQTLANLQENASERLARAQRSADEARVDAEHSAR